MLARNRAEVGHVLGPFSTVVPPQLVDGHGIDVPAPLHCDRHFDDRKIEDGDAAGWAADH